MAYVTITTLVDGKMKELARVWPDRTFSGDEFIKDRLENTYLIDPITGEKVAEGIPWLRAVARSYSNMLMQSDIIPEEGDDVEELRGR